MCACTGLCDRTHLTQADIAFVPLVCKRSALILASLKFLFTTKCFWRLKLFFYILLLYFYTYFKFFLTYSSHVSCHETSCIVQCWLQLPLSCSVIFFQYHFGNFPHLKVGKKCLCHFFWNLEGLWFIYSQGNIVEVIRVWRFSWNFQQQNCFNCWEAAMNWGKSKRPRLRTHMK